MRSWGRGVFRSLSGVPRPTDDPRVHASGLDSDRILIFGSGAAVGWGVLSHDLAVPGALARSLSKLTGRGVDVDVITEPDLRLANAVRDLTGIDVSRYDGIVLTLGLMEAVGLASPSSWRRDLDSLLSYLNSVAPHTPIFVVGIHSTTQITRYDAMVAPIITHSRGALNRVSSQLAAHRERVTFVPFDAPERTHRDRYRTKSEYQDAGSLLASAIAPVMDADHDHRGGGRPRQRPLDTLARRNALDEFAILETMSDEAFQRLTEFARRSLHTSAAKITIVGGNRFWTIASRGVSPTEGTRDESICFTAIEYEDALVVPDVSLDPRFADMHHIQGPPPVRFYAGHRIEAPNGVPIGVLCVQDAEARDADSFDRALLRDIALLVQKEIWLAAQATTTAGYANTRAPHPIAIPVERTYLPAASPL
jgi:hypothetical protein